MKDEIRIWDVPLRLFHWTLVLAIVGAMVSGWVGGNLMIWHERLGLAVLWLLVFRLVWGVVGSTYARWSEILMAPLHAIDYLKGQWSTPGHNPLGSLSVIALLTLIGFQTFSGLAGTDDIALQGPLYRLFDSDTGSLLTGLHRQGKWLLIGLVGLHILAILYYALIKKKPLVMAMLLGRRERFDASERDAEGGSWWGLLLAIGCATIAVYVVLSISGWMAPPPPPPAPTLGW